MPWISLWLSSPFKALLPERMKINNSFNFLFHSHLKIAFFFPEPTSIPPDFNTKFVKAQILTFTSFWKPPARVLTYLRPANLTRLPLPSIRFRVGENVPASDNKDIIRILSHNKLCQWTVCWTAQMNFVLK